MSASRGVVLLSGGLGGGRLAPPLTEALGPGRLSVVANVGDDLTWRGLRVCPDIDTILYALAGVWDEEQGWGIRGDTWRVRLALASRGETSWFNVGDTDLATHLLRTERLTAGASLSEVVADLARRLGVEGTRVVPACDQPAETQIEAPDGSSRHFQEWYVRERASVEVAAVRLATEPAAPAALEAISAAAAVIIGPSNPITSIGAILALDGAREAVAAVPSRIVVSPVVVGRPAIGERDRHHMDARKRLLSAEGCDDTPLDTARRHASIGEIDTFVLDESDAAEAPRIEHLGPRVVLTDLLDATVLATTLAGLVEP